MYRIGAVALILAGGLVTQLVVAANPVERNGQVVSIALAKRFSVAVASTMGGQIYGNLNIGFANSAVSPRGDLVAVGSTEDPGNQAGAPFRSSGYKVTNIVDIKTGKTIARIQDAWPVAFSPDGNTLLVKQYFTRAIQKAGLGIGAVLSVPPTTQLWDLSKPEKPVQRFVIDAATVEAFSDDGKILVCYAGSKGKMGNSGKPVAGLPRFDRKKLPGGGGGVIFAVDSIDLIELWEVETGNLLARMRPPKNHGPELAPAIFHPNGHVVAIPLSDLSALANIRGAARPQDLDRFWNTVSSKIVLFDFKAKKKIQTIACPGKINQMRFIRPSASMLESTGRPLLVVSTFKRAEASLFIFDPETGKRTATLLEKKGPGAKIKFALSPVEATLAAEFSFTEKKPWPG
ncbi:MAG: hypothetical protein KatS3mg105_1866 [Gemmatales bacterium]|nr:MAG: hypothetical protein KatS3mg105_1866 [Gemmatales bacterium]